ncbi:AMP-binding enzyme [Treponema phagedenis F0421]|uniref:AMP-binding protein n=1 Tax=Treponema phagedenis TaxID=162 RepID=UPI0001F642A7|nr:AMP-binding protein [Treponema phagedenis]EFW39024.1 AMP-binding enzyme [Treponema phagedenis F0421]
MQTINELGKHTFSAMLENSVNRFGDRPAVSYVSAEPLTYNDFYEKVKEVRQLLYSVGIRAGTQVAIYATSCPHWGIAYFAIVTMGAIVVPLLPDFSARETEACLTHSETTHMLVDERLKSKIPEAYLQTIINIGDFSLIKGEKVSDEVPPAHECNEEDTASIIYTSGTTGRSKAVELTHKNFISNAIAGQSCQRINEYDVALSILPMSHVYEFTIGFLMFFLNGACIFYLIGPPTPRLLIPALQKVRPTMMLSVPMVIEKIYKTQVVPAFTASPLKKKITSTRLGRKLFSRIAGKKLLKTFGGRIKFFGIGGAKTDPAVEQFMKDAKFPYAIGYGLTETSPLIAGSSPKQTVPEWIGYVIPEVDVKLINVNPETGIGELVVKGPNVMKGYYKDPELTDESFTEDGYFKTGDLFFIDSKGHVSIKGRSKNMIVGANGENIYPEDIEFVLNQHPFVSEALVVEGEHSSLVALVQLDEEKLAAELKKMEEVTVAEADKKDDENTRLQNLQEAMGDAMADFSNAMTYKRAEILNEIKFFVNSHVNKISRIDKVEPVEKFEKTASQKIKRYLYNFRKKSNEKTPEN